MSREYPTGESVAWVADTGFFVACGRQESDKYAALERFVRRNGITFVIPQRVYEELGGAPARSTAGQTPTNAAIEDGWVRVADEPDYSDSAVSAVMDDVREFIAQSSNREPDQVEKADTALGAVAVELLGEGASEVCVVTTDLDAGRAVIDAVSRQGFEDRVRFENGFELVEEIS